MEVGGLKTEADGPQQKCMQRDCPQRLGPSSARLCIIDSASEPLLIEPSEGKVRCVLLYESQIDFQIPSSSHWKKRGCFYGLGGASPVTRRAQRRSPGKDAWGQLGPLRSRGFLCQGRGQSSERPREVDVEWLRFIRKGR